MYNKIMNSKIINYLNSNNIKFTELSLTDNEFSACLDLFVSESIIYSGENDYSTTMKHLEKLQLVQINYSIDDPDTTYLLTDKTREKLNAILLNHTNKKQWEACLSFFHNDRKLNIDLHEETIFITFIGNFNQVECIAYWNETLNIGNIMHPNDYNEDYKANATINLSKQILELKINSQQKKHNKCKI